MWRSAVRAHTRRSIPTVEMRTGEREVALAPERAAPAIERMTHLESFRADTVDARSAYVAISRARSHAAVYTDS